MVIDDIGKRVCLVTSLAFEFVLYFKLIITYLLFCGNKHNAIKIDVDRCLLCTDDAGSTIT